MDAAERETLFDQTLEGDYDSDEAWAAVRALHRDASQETFDRAFAWTFEEDRRKRARAVDILCGLYRTEEGSISPHFVFREETYARVAELMDKEQDSDVLLSEINALGQLAKEDGVPRILRFLDHSDPEYRYAVAMALGHCPNHPAAVRGLLQLCTDSDDEIRDWAVFGLGVQGDADSDEIRAVLLNCLGDESLTVREEAAAGLGKRKDVRLLPKLFAMLDNPDFSAVVGDAAAGMLGFERDNKDLSAEDYKTALRREYPGFSE